MDLIQGFLCIRLHVPAVQGAHAVAHYAADHIGLRIFTVQLYILGYCIGRKQHELLMHHSNAQVHGLSRRYHLYGLSFPYDLPLISPGIHNTGHPKQDIHQRGLSSPVLPYQGNDLAFAHLQADAFEHLVPIEFFFDIFHFQNYILHSFLLTNPVHDITVLPWHAASGSMPAGPI